MSTGDIGVVIRNWNGMVVRRSSGPVDSSYANKAEVFALLIECRELLKLGCYNYILEGDFFSAIQWGLGKSCLAVSGLGGGGARYISHQLRASFHHILR